MEYKVLYKRAKPYVGIIIFQFAYAGLAIIAKYALDQGMNTYTFSVYRSLFATLVISPFAIFFERRKRPNMTISIFFKITLLALLEPVIDQNLYYIGMRYTSATFTTAMCNIIPAVAFMMAWIFRLEKVNVKKLESQAKIIGTIVTVGGAMVMTLVKGPTIGLPWTNGTGLLHQHQSANPTTRDNVKGAIMIAAGCFSWACFYILQAITLKSYPAELSLTALICGTAAVQNTILTLIVERGKSSIWALHWNAKLLAPLWGGVICSGWGYYLAGVVMRERGPVFVTAFSPLSTIVVAILGSIFLDEKMNLGRVVGAATIIAGLYLVLWGKSKDENLSKSGLAKLVPVEEQQELPITNSVTTNATQNHDGGLSIPKPTPEATENS